MKPRAANRATSPFFTGVFVILGLLIAIHAAGRVWFAYALFAASGSGARRCGTVGRDADRRAAVRCAETALAEGAAFRVAFWATGVDSSVEVGLAANARRELSRVDYDSSVLGTGLPAPHVERRACGAPILNVRRAEEPVRCATTVDP